MSSLVEALAVPPGIVLVMFVASLILLLFRKRNAGVILLALGIVFLYLGAIDPVSRALLLPLEDRYPPLSGASADSGRAAGAGGALDGSTATKRPIHGAGPIVPTDDSANPGFGMADVVVVLGGGTVTGSPDGSAYSPQEGAFKRMVYAAALAERLQLPIIAGGGTVSKPPGTQTEADAARDYLRGIGFPDSRIFVEDRSTTTWETAVNVAARFRPHHVFLVTSAYHMARSVLSFRAQGLDVTAAPTDYLVDRPATRIGALIPTSAGMRRTSIALHEYLGILAYRLRS